MRQKIEGESAIVSRWIHALKQEHGADELEVEGDNTPFNDQLDTAEIVAEHETRLELLERLIEKARKFEEALHRMPTGLFGICTACRRPIHKQRLEALPEADLCLKCQRQSERSKRIAS
jgi:DnaK suppressor protein